MREAYLIDPEPGAVRLGVVVIFIVGFVGGFLLISQIFGLEGCSILGIFGGLGIAVVLMLIAENLLKKVWQSNRRLVLEDERMAFEFAGDERRAINPAQTINVTAWRFTTKRRTRVPKGWYMIAINFEQDDIYLPVYTLMPPEDFDKLEFKDTFFELTGSRKDLENEEDLRLAGKKRRILMAETARSIDGVEMRPEDFIMFIESLRKNFTRWMPA